MALAAPGVDVAAARDGGYWVAAADGGVMARGGAAFHGSTGGVTLRRPVVAISATPSGQGYRLIAADGGVFTFGDALYLGALADDASDAPTVDIARSPTGLGYSILTATGQVGTFGDAAHHGDGPAGDGFFGLAVTALGRGYWLVSQTAS